MLFVVFDLPRSWFHLILLTISMQFVIASSKSKKVLIVEFSDTNSTILFKVFQYAASCIANHTLPKVEPPHMLHAIL